MHDVAHYSSLAGLVLCGRGLDWHFGRAAWPLTGPGTAFRGNYVGFVTPVKLPWPPIGGIVDHFNLTI